MEPLRLSVPTAAGGTTVRAIIDLPDGPARGTYLFAHGAGAGLDHWFMEAMAARLAARGLRTVRFNFPYLEAQRRRPDPPAVLHATVAAALAWARERFTDGPLLCGGKSMGGRMSSQAAAAGLLDGVAGLLFLGFPLHPAGKPGRERAVHLAQVAVPMQFVQGDRDELADLRLLQPVIEGLGARARLHVVRGADHGFEVLKRSGRTGDEVLDEAADVALAFCAALP